MDGNEDSLGCWALILVAAVVLILWEPIVVALSLAFSPVRIWHLRRLTKRLQNPEAWSSRDKEYERIARFAKYFPKSFASIRGDLEPLLRSHMKAGESYYEISALIERLGWLEIAKEVDEEISNERAKKAEEARIHSEQMSNYGGCGKSGAWPTIEKIRNVSLKDITNIEAPPGEAVSLREATGELVKIRSLVGGGLYSATIDVANTTPSTIRIFVPQGLTLESAGRHQTMAVRQNKIVSIRNSGSFSVPVVCLDFNKRIPQAFDRFSGLGECDELVIIVLQICAMVRCHLVDDFVTQLAIWLVTDNVNLDDIQIGDFRRARSPDLCEKVAANEIAKKARELLGSNRSKG